MDGRGAGVAALGMLLVLPLGLSDGGYYGRSLTALTLALAAGAALVLLRPLEARRPSRTLTAAVFALALLSAWVALSSLWAEPGAGVALETRRCILYAVAVLAVGVAAGGRRRAFLLALATAVSTLAIVGIVMRVAAGVPVDPYYGGLLGEPVGYPNAMGVLAATAVVLAIGLGDWAGKACRARATSPRTLPDPRPRVDGEPWRGACPRGGSRGARRPVGAAGALGVRGQSCVGDRARRWSLGSHCRLRRRRRSAGDRGRRRRDARRRSSDARAAWRLRCWRAAWRSPGPRLPPCIRPRRRRAFARRTGRPRWPRCGSDRFSGAAPAAST